MPIDRRTFLQRCGQGAMAGWLASRGFAQGKRPNVLILQPDQHRGSIMGCAGDTQAITPNLDRLASQGTRFSRGTSCHPVCSPFRGTMQTGMYCHNHGVVSNNIAMSPDLVCFAEVFEAAGYATGYIGKWHIDGGWPKSEGGEGLTPKTVGGFVPPERRQGWQEWRGYEKSHEFFEVWEYDDQARKHRVEGYDWEPTWQTDVALEFIRRHQSAGTPWCYYLAYGPPHNPEQCPQRFLDLFPPDKLAIPPDAAAVPENLHANLRRHLQVYYGQVAAIDEEVGRVMAGLEQAGAANDTLILYVSDHGDYLGAHYDETKNLRGKARPYRSAFGIPMIFRWPGHVPAGKVDDTPVGHIDLAPTLLGLAGLPVPETMDGVSRAGWCLGGETPANPVIFLGLGNGLPLPPEAKEASNAPTGQRLLDEAVPAGPNHGTNPEKMASGNWSCGYDQRFRVDLKPGRHELTIAMKGGKGRLEVEYRLLDYVTGQAEFSVPTSEKYNFKEQPHNRFTIGVDGRVEPSDALRGHLYATSGRSNPPTLVLDAPRPCALELHLTRSVGDNTNRLQVYEATAEAEDDGDGEVLPAPEPKATGWWRAAYDGRYVYEPGKRLYDHAEDPDELANRIDDPALAEVRARLGQALVALSEGSGDPVIKHLRERVAG